jgi:hypothetical protein
MFLELAKPITFVFCILSLYALFYTVFLDPAHDLNQRIWESGGLLVVAAVISVASGLIFRDESQEHSSARPRLVGTLPVQMFCWATSIMLVLFLVSWYLKAHCILYRDIRIWV